MLDIGTRAEHAAVPLANSDHRQSVCKARVRNEVIVHQSYSLANAATTQASIKLLPLPLHLYMLADKPQCCPSLQLSYLQMPIDTISVLAALFTAWAARELWFTLHSLFFSPLRSFPGPRVAAATAWYKAWQEVFLGRCWIDVLQELHERYGTVVRVAPNEVLRTTLASVYCLHSHCN